MDFLVTLQCEDQPGIVHAMATAILACEGNIIENQQFTDPDSLIFVMRTRFESSKSVEETEVILRQHLDIFRPTLMLRPYAEKKRALILATKERHCLQELIFLVELNEMPIEIVGVVSNHLDLKPLVESHGLAFTYIPISSSGKEASELEIYDLVQRLGVDFIILARYMQILSEGFCEQLPNRIINIHHSFLPSFKGANPYRQAYARGVKIIGATAHFATPDLDEGPIIEQDISHINHSYTPNELVAIGRDIERRVLARAVKLFSEDRIFVVGIRTVIL